MSMIECRNCGRIADVRCFRPCRDCGAPLCDDCANEGDDRCMDCGEPPRYAPQGARGALRFPF